MSKPAAPPSIEAPLYFRTNVSHIGNDAVMLLHVCRGGQDMPVTSMAMTQGEALEFGRRLVKFGKKGH